MVISNLIEIKINDYLFGNDDEFEFVFLNCKSNSFKFQSQCLTGMTKKTDIHKNFYHLIDVKKDDHVLSFFCCQWITPSFRFDSSIITRLRGGDF